MDELHQRIETLEKENRRWKVVSISVVTALILAGVFQQVRYSSALHDAREEREQVQRQAEEALQHEREMRVRAQDELAVALQRAEAARQESEMARKAAEEELAKLRK